MESASEQLNALFAIILAGGLAAIPGLDREKRRRPAGLRTHMLVAMSCAMITLGAEMAFDAEAAGRIIANILTGIGFLGAGVIVKRKSEVYDLTTATSIWTVALIGVIVGSGLYILAIGATIIIGFVLTVLRNFEDKKHLPAEKN